MLSVTSTIAYATVFNVLFGTDRTLSVIIGGAIVMLYSSIGGMWSITLTDMVQFILKTIGIFFLLLPFTWNKAGGFDGIRERAGDTVFDLGAIGIADDHHVLRRLQLRHADRAGHLAAGVHRALAGGRQVGRHRPPRCTACCYGVAGALIGMAASTFLPDVEAKDDVYAQIAETILPVGHQRHRAGGRGRGDDVHRVGRADRHRHRGHAPT